MSESTTGPIGSAVAGSGEPSAPPVQSGSPTTEPSSFTRASLLESLPEQIRGEPVFQNLNETNPIPDLANQFLNAQKMIGTKRLPVPDESWTPEQWNDFHSQIGRPDTHDKYTLPKVEGVEWDDTKVSEFREMAYNMGLTDKQFSTVMEKYAGEVTGMQQSASEQMKEQINTGLQNLRNELSQSGKDFNTVLELANEGLVSFGDEGLVVLFNQNAQLANHPSIIKMFASLAEANRESLARDSGVRKIGGNLDAKQAIQEFTEKHKDILFADPSSLSMDKRDERDRLVKKRDELYQIAYKEQ